jgi:hypothetical protein
MTATSPTSPRQLRKSVGEYFDGVRVSSHYKSQIRRDALRLMQERGVGDGRWPLSRLNPQRRISLHDAIFLTENDLESQGSGRPDHPTVVALRQVRNRVLDDIGWNEADDDVATAPASTAA